MAQARKDAIAHRWLIAITSILPRTLGGKTCETQSSLRYTADRAPSEKMMVRLEIGEVKTCAPSPLSSNRAGIDHVVNGRTLPVCMSNKKENEPEGTQEGSQSIRDT
jgi:hypothetical protein